VPPLLPFHGVRAKVAILPPLLPPLPFHGYGQRLRLLPLLPLIGCEQRLRLLPLRLLPLLALVKSKGAAGKSKGAKPKAKVLQAKAKVASPFAFAILPPLLPLRCCRQKQRLPLNGVRAKVAILPLLLPVRCKSKSKGCL